MTTDTTERGLERLICTALTGQPCGPPATDAAHERPPTYGAGWACGDSKDYDREFCVDLAQLAEFLRATQPEVANRSTSTRTARRGAGSWPACKARSPSAAPSTCCARGSSTDRINSTCSMARRHRGTRRPGFSTGKTASASPVNSATAATRPSFPWTWACSSTACRSPPSS